MPKLNQQGAVHLFVPFILLTGLVAGVYLVSSNNTLKLFSKASSSGSIVFKSNDGKNLPKKNDIPYTSYSTVKVELNSPLGNAVAASKVCAQVITPAKDPQTGQCIEFPTPCDVPSGWT